MEYRYSIIGLEPSNTFRFTEQMKFFSRYKSQGIYNDYDEAMDQTLKNLPHLIFFNLDREFEEGSPFHFVNELSQYIEQLPLCIALSKNRNKAYQVIKSRFHDYLIMPLSEFELRKCLLRLEKRFLSHNVDKICLKSYSDYRFIESNKILYLRADNNTTDFFMSGRIKKITAFNNLKYFTSILPKNFIRIHNSYMINKDYISRINFGKSEVSLTSDHIIIPFSRNYRNVMENLKDVLSRLST